MQPTEAPAKASRSDTLALLYQNILTGIVRIQAVRQPLTDVETFRKRMKAALQEVEREANVAGYASGEVRDAEFAVVAFLDESILSSREPKAEEWRKRPLNIELFGQAIAGDVFFDKLGDIERRGDSPQLADLLEVYLLCLLLGFEGRFAPPLRGEAYRIIDRIRRRIELVRGTDYKLSPPMDFAQAPADPLPQRLPKWRWWILASPLVPILLFWLYRWSLSSRIDQLQSVLAALR